VVVAAPPKASPITAYAEAVTRGEIVTGRLVRLACERHLRDLQTADERGLWFDDEAAEHTLRFFGFLRHSKGEWAGEPFKLEPWQQFIIGVLFGWKRADGTRRFRTAFVEVARKNGKSTISAGVGLYLAFADDEPGAEVYVAACKRDQAKIVWGEARRMVQQSPALKRRVTVFVGNLHIAGTASKFEPLGADSDSMDGLNVHGNIIDELHAHKTRTMWDVLQTATGSRRQPLTFVITTAGYDRHSICWEQHDYGIKVLEGIIEDDTFFSYIAALDEGDDWKDRSVWVKANPNLGVSVKVESIEQDCAKAEQVPGEQNAFRRLRLDEWTEQASRWIDMEVYDKGSVPVDPDALLGHSCFAGLDLASVRDVTAFILWFADDEGGVDVLPFFWIPDEGMRQRSERDRVPYDVWVREGYMEVTEGNITDYDVIRERIKGLGDQYNIREIAYDRWGATQLVTQLTEDGATCVPMGQGFASLSAPTKELEKLLLAGKFRHGGHPVLRWMFSNVAIQQDSAGNMKPAKDKSFEKIDGVMATVMACGRAMVAPAEEETSGVFFV